MSENKRHIDDIVRQGLSDHRSIPPAEAWAIINTRLENKKRAGFIYNLIRVAAAIIILVGFGGGLMQMLRQVEPDKNYLTTVERLEPFLPEVAELPAPRHTHTPDAEIIVGVVDMEAPSEVYFRESEINHDMRLTSVIMEPEVFEPGRMSPLPVTSTDPIEYKDPPLLSYLPDYIAGEEKPGRWSAGIMGAPGFSYRSLSMGNPGSFSKSLYNDIESGILSFSGRLMLSYRITERLSVQTGIDLVKMGQSIENIYLLSHSSYLDIITPESSAVSNSLGEISTTGSDVLLSGRRLYTEDKTGTIPATGYQPLSMDTGRSRVVQELQYIHTPLVFRYLILSGKFDLLASGGIGAGFLADNRVSYRSGDESIMIGRTGNVKNFGISGIAGIGIEYKLPNKMTVILEPRFTHFITPANNGAQHNFRPYSFSFYSGISFRF
jgi:hypothetical protein